MPDRTRDKVVEALSSRFSPPAPEAAPISYGDLYAQSLKLMPDRGRPGWRSPEEMDDELGRIMAEQRARVERQIAEKEWQERMGQEGVPGGGARVAEGTPAREMMLRLDRELTTESSDERRVQQALLRAGYDLGDDGADGYFGPTSRKALNKFVAEKIGRPDLQFNAGDVVPRWVIEQVLGM